MAEATGRRPNDYFVRAAERTLGVLASFDRDHQRLSAYEVAERAGLDPATARRLLYTLRDLGYVRSTGRDFELTPRILAVGYAYLGTQSLVEIAHSHLEQLAHRLGETSSFTVLDGDDVVYLDVVAGRRYISTRVGVGTRFPAHATSMGRVLLAGLPEELLNAYLGRLAHTERHEHQQRTIDDLRAEVHRVRKVGWSLVDGELEAGLRGIATAVHDREGVAVAALNVSAHSARSSAEDLTSTYVPALRATTDAIESDLRGYA